MQLKSVPIAALGLLATISASSLSTKQDRKEALSLLQQGRFPRRNHGTFEELKDDNYERECVQEICDREELDEIFPENKEEADRKWATLVDQCHVTPCSAVGTAKCVQRWRARTCVCLTHVNGTESVEGVARFTGTDCQDDVDECADKATKTKCGEKSCINTVGSFKCGCDQGYEDVAGECVDIDECASGDVCGDNASCVNQPGSHTCECDDGYTEDPEDSSRCVNINECEDDNICSFSGLSKTCVDSEGSYSCVCSEPGYSADAEGDCVDINECEVSCLGEHENCINLPGSHECHCDTGYEMVAGVCVDVNECESGEADCENCDCKNTSGSFECVDSSTHNFSSGVCTLKDACDNVVCGIDQECNAGNCVCTKGDGWNTVPVDGFCSDLNECENELACNEGESCINLPGSFECVPVPTVPQLAPTVPSMCPSGFEHDGDECVDIDECQENNGGCPGMCINLYGDFMCYESFDSERPLCHHFTKIDAGIVPYGYECGCYEGYELCEDGFTCTCTGNQYVKKIDDSLDCGSCQFDYEGKCYQESEHEDTFASAEASCVSRGGSLAKISTRDAWWNIGSQVHNGKAAFWISENSDAVAANMYVVGTAGNLLANSPMNMAHVPPQWNKASVDETHHFVCSFPSGRVAVDACVKGQGAKYEDVIGAQEVTTEVNTPELAAETTTVEEATTEEASTINFHNGQTTNYESAETTEFSGEHK